MNIRIDLNGKKRKDLAHAIGELLNAEPQYQKTPSHAYHIGGAVLDKENTLSFPPDMNPEAVRPLLDSLQDKGFKVELPDKLVIQMPLDGFTPEKIDNLCKLVDAKAGLIKAALGAEDLPIEQTEKALCFSWLDFNTPSEDVAAYSQFIAALCDMAKKQKRVVATEKQVENQKYAFRCFLLRLGFIGDQYAATRRVLLRNLSGNGSLKGEKSEAAPPPSPSAFEESAEAVGKHLLRGLIQYLEAVL